jgi:hypothetical protein
VHHAEDVSTDLGAKGFEVRGIGHGYGGDKFVQK